MPTCNETWTKHSINGWRDENDIPCKWLEVCAFEDGHVNVMARPNKNSRASNGYIKSHYPKYCYAHYSIRLTPKLYLALALTFGGNNKELFLEKRFVDWLLEFDKHERKAANR